MLYTLNVITLLPLDKAADAAILRVIEAYCTAYKRTLIRKILICPSVCLSVCLYRGAVAVVCCTNYMRAHVISMCTIIEVPPCGVCLSLLSLICCSSTSLREGKACTVYEIVVFCTAPLVHIVMYPITFGTVKPLFQSANMFQC